MVTLYKKEVNGLERGKDYEILTFTVTNLDMQVIPFGRFFRKDILTYANMKNELPLDKVIKEKYEDYPNVFMIHNTRPLKGDVTLFLLEEGMVDFNTAMDCGFGVIKMLTGEHENKYFLYNSENEAENIPLMLDVYLQLSVKDYENKSLHTMIITEFGRDLIKVLQYTDGVDLYSRLLTSFSNEKLH